MESNSIAAALQRIMNRVDYYLHCEIDEEYERDKPAHARARLEQALREELLKAHAEGLVTGIRGSANAVPAASNADAPGASAG